MDSPAPLVTIGIPTFNRPALLGRALECIGRQSHPNLEVMVADNAGPSAEVDAVIESFNARIPALRFVRHPSNIGALNNFAFLLAASSGEYFMWLADDDQISDNYVSSLVEILEADPEVATAAGNWHLMTSAETGALVRPRQYLHRSPLARAAKYLWRADDAFFYGLHRKSVLVEASFPGYSWPNRNTFMNWAYVFLLDVVLRGKVKIHPDPAVRFVNHDYTAKDYSRARGGIAGSLQRAARRLNVHYLYLVKIRSHIGFLAALTCAAVSMASLASEAVRALASTAARRIRGGWKLLEQAK